MASTIRGLTIEIDGNTKPLVNALGEINAKSRDVATELRQVERLLKLDPSNADLAAQKQKILTEAVANTTEKLKTLKEAEKQAQQQFKEGKISEEQYRALQREIMTAEQELGKLSKQLKELDWKKLTDGLDKVGKSSVDLGKKMSIGLTAPILGIAGAAVKIGMDFEEAMSKVQALSGASASDMERLEKAARDAGASTSKTAKESADALGYMALAGWDVEKSIDGLMPVLRLSEAGQMDLGRASSLVTDTMSSMGIEVENLMGYLDILAQTARNSNTDIDQMAEAYVSVGGVLRGLDIPLEESALALGFLANAGIKGSEAGKGLSAVLINLTAPTGRAKKALEELGYSTFDSEGNFKGLEVVLKELGERMGDMDQEQRNIYLSMLGGKNHVKDLNALLNGMTDSYDVLTEAIQNSEGALEDTALTMRSNTKGQIIELKSALEELALKIADVLLPIVSDLISWIKGVVDWLNNLSPEMQRVIVIVAGVVATIGPLLIVFGKMAMGVSAIIKVIGPLMAIIGKLGGFIGLLVGKVGGIIKILSVFVGGIGKAIAGTKAFAAAATFLTGPIGLIVVAIGALIGIIVYLWKTNETFRESVIELWNNIKEAVVNVVGAIAKAWDWLIKGASNVIGAYVNLGKNIANFFQNLIKEAFNWGKNLISGFIDGIKNMGKNIKGAVSGVIGGVKDFLGFKSPTKKGEGRYITQWGENMVQGFIDGINKAKPDLNRSLEGLMPNLDTSQTIINKQMGSIDHTGVIRVEGVNDAGQLEGVVDILMTQLRREARV